MGPVGIAMGAMKAYSSIKESKRAKKNAKQAQKAADRQRAETLGMAGPEAYGKNYEFYRKLYQDAYMPHLRSIGEALALGEQSGLQGFDADVARRGLSGSGLALAGRSAIRSGRQANYNQALRDFYNQAESRAGGQADVTSARQIGASMGAPIQYIPRPAGGGEAYAGAALQGLGTATGVGSLMGYGTQANPSFFRRTPTATPGYGLYDIGGGQYAM